MVDFDPAVHDAEYFAKRRVPAMVAYLSPFRLVEAPESSPWSVNIQEINKGGWDYVALHEIVGGIDVGLEKPYHLVVARDGAMALPPIADLRSEQEAVEFFNRCFAAFLLGGVYCEAIGLDGLEFGSVFDWKYVRSRTSGMAAPNRLHKQFRMGTGSPLDTIALLDPRTIEIGQLEKAMAQGRDILSRLPEVNAEFLLKGTTGYARRDWGAALANLWIVVEQVSSHLWTNQVLNPVKGNPSIPGRSSQLADYRTWTTGVRLEVLHQIGKISAETLALLSEARKARNDLSHRGNHPSASAARAAWEGVARLIQIAVPDVPIPLLSLNLEDHTLSDPFEPREPQRLEPKYWMPIPKLPGEEEFEKLESKFFTGQKNTPGGCGSE